MRDRRLLFEPLREFERLEIIKGELEDRYVAAAYDTGDVATAQLATAIASIVRAQADLAVHLGGAARARAHVEAPRLQLVE
jgi:hypothetical protein